MPKLTVTLPNGYNTQLLMEAKDFSTLCEIVDRSQGFTSNYHKGEYYYTKTGLRTSAELTAGIKIISDEEFMAIKAQTEEVEE